MLQCTTHWDDAFRRQSPNDINELAQNECEIAKAPPHGFINELNLLTGNPDNGERHNRLRNCPH
jgi:hypothetical protein